MTESIADLGDDMEVQLKNSHKSTALRSQKTSAVSHRRTSSKDNLLGLPEDAQTKKSLGNKLSPASKRISLIPEAD